MSNKKVAIIGATGYTGSELIRFLHHHPEAEVSLITSESRKGEKLSDVHPFFNGFTDQLLHPASAIEDHSVDIAFLALPHGVSMEYVKKFKDLKIPIIDLSGDFRLETPEIYEKWYNKKHTYTAGFEKAVYGLPELYRSEIPSAEIIANPGCYPTSVILALAPLVKEGWLDTDFIIADSKSGVTGAGIKASAVNQFSGVNDNFKAYAIKTHRHSAEIGEKLSLVSGKDLKVQFTPHLIPVDRGILSTVYGKSKNPGISEQSLRELFESFYKGEPFVKIGDTAPTLKEVRGTNFCKIFCTYDQNTGNIIIISVIDNLVKGAAGQAIQNMNLLFGWDETSGLNQIPLNP
ncbi:MAG: N-acetyl-gamma-glutamyl-phosphate reductase [Saprospirales bacterium]|nr:MAG: N-acetyl-gamma-glutamyl-phosphate reductase [Saprospirales bacterium]